MPELPEVECARCLIHDNCLNKKIKRISHDEHDDIVFVNCLDKVSKFKGKTITAVKRKGKWLWIEFNKKPHMCVHLGMTGGFLVRDVDSVQYRNTKFDKSGWPPKFWKIQFEFTDGTELAFVNSRRLGRVRITDDPLSEKPIAALGWDAYTEKMELEEFSKLLLRRKAPIKALLLNQSFTAGVGNWIADEILYHAEVHPAQRANFLTDEQVEQIYEKLIFVIKLACEVNADYKKFPPEWLFHFRWTGKKETTDFHDRVIKFETVGGRTSAFVPEIQKLCSQSVMEGKKMKRKKKKSESPKPKEKKKVSKKKSKAKKSKTKKRVAKKRSAKKSAKKRKQTRKSSRPKKKAKVEKEDSKPTRRSVRILARKLAKKK